MIRLYLDFETQSYVSLKKVGVYKYAAHPSTKVMCAGWLARWDSGTDTLPNMYVRNRALVAGLDLVTHCRLSDEASFVMLAERTDCILIAHNVEFERQVLKEKYGVHVPLSRCSCTSARSSRMSLPRALQDACDVLGLDERKDMDGHRALMKLTRPRRPTKSNTDDFWTEETKPEDYVKTIEYCYQDVMAMMELDAAVPELPPTERELWMATIEMNERGLRADMPAVYEAVALAAKEKARLELEFQALVGCGVKSQKAPAALGVPNMQKATVRDALKRTDLSPGQRRGLEIRKEHSKSAVDKLKAIVNREQGGVVRGSLVYAGAERTNRWSGAGIQPQNFIRGLGKGTEDAFRALMAGALDVLYPDVLDTLSKMMKGFFKGPFCVGDYSQVECRSLAWLAGETVLLDLFKSGGDPYCALAMEIYHREITKKDDFERQLGKQGVLGCGYGIGADGFRRLLDEKYDIQISQELAEQVVTTYRRKFQKIIRFWKRMERGFVYIAQALVGTAIVASDPGLPVIKMGRIDVRGRPFSYIELPSGRKLYYAYPEVNDGPYGREASFLGRNFIYQWAMVKAYGGQLTGHIAQAFARDLLGEAILRLRRLGFHLALTVHDEVVSEEKRTWATHTFQDGPADNEPPLETFNREMNRVPAWAAGLPLTAECFTCDRYRK